MNNPKLSILQFEPIFKQKIWGGSKLQDYLNKSVTDTNVGESWEISDVDDAMSVVSNGLHKGKTLRSLIALYGADLVGYKNSKRFGAAFPLLIKFIDAKENLSVQLHPGDTIAKAKHNSLGKTEMWHIVQADKDAEIIIGFNKEISEAEYKQRVSEGTIAEVLNREKVAAGDTFFVYAGLIHAIGAGVVLAEIQQTSDITYRIYDWDRQDKDGNYRALHQKEALDAIDFDSTQPYKIDQVETQNQLTNLVRCDHFITNTIHITKAQCISHLGLDSFVIYMCVEGVVKVKDGEESIALHMGNTILVPACIEDIEIVDGNGKLLQVYI
ncbi:type I phosphomannose isomerase catalytic subunit [Aquimarina brevivitae]|uniref:Phosphohexomutase n=1 Tax=Aquimarina brevivitae TaxID=323412 RepID=A0A4Q7P097_9FLAO|nr:type I phosphomannose isomerase catalytic subunit [Aquimarina brevivitae]RZS93105.1 mannose-6-phosphate isomerase type 1 [Aquimarina brevivitae]